MSKYDVMLRFQVEADEDREVTAMTNEISFLITKYTEEVLVRFERIGTVHEKSGAAILSNQPKDV
jgi:hypothetical protein